MRVIRECTKEEVPFGGKVELDILLEDLNILRKEYFVAKDRYHKRTKDLKEFLNSDRHEIDLGPLSQKARDVLQGSEEE